MVLFESGPPIVPLSPQVVVRSVSLIFISSCFISPLRCRLHCPLTKLESQKGNQSSLAALRGGESLKKTAH